MQSHRGKAPASGFTLIEVMVSLTILTGLLAVTYSGLSVALTMWGKSGLRVEAFNERQTATTILVGQIRGALPMFYSRQEEIQPRQRLAFEGEPNRLRFISRTSWRDGGNAVPRWVEIHWDGRLFIDERQILPPTNGPSEQPVWKSELSMFEDFQLRYLRRAQLDRPVEWFSSWDFAERREFPAAVEIRYRIRGESIEHVIPLDYAEASWKGWQLQ